MNRRPALISSCSSVSVRLRALLLLLGMLLCSTGLAQTIVVSPTTLPAPTVGSAYSQTIIASGGTAPYSFAITAGALPAGLTLASGGTLSGTPTAGGTFNFTVTATDSDAGGPLTGSRAYSLTVNAPTISISPTTLPSASVGAPYSQSITASGGTAPHSFSLTAGSIPAGMTLSGGGILSGTPTAGGTFNFTVTATDSSTGTGPYFGSRAYSLTVAAEQPPIANPVSATVGYGSGANPITLNITGGVPILVSVASAPTNGTAIASGTSITYQPNAGFAGADSFTYTATNAGGTSAPATVTITVAAPTITLSPTTLPAAVVGTPYSQTLTASGGTGPYTFSLPAGSLPPGVSFSGGGVLSGTPTGTGTFTFTVIATDSSTGTGPFTGISLYTLTVSAPPTITIAPATLPATTVGTVYSQTLTASGGTAPYAFAITAGALPAGLTLSSGGTLSGTSTAGGTFNFTATATDSGGYTGSQAYTLVVNAPLIVIPFAPPPDPVVGTPYSYAIPVSGGTAPYSFVLTNGSLPAGMTLSSAGVLSGTPVAVGLSTFSVTATDSSTGTGPFTGARQYTLTVISGTITISPATLPPATAGTAYSQTLTASGGTGPYTFAVTAGTLPAGLSLSSAGVLSGTPTGSEGAFRFNFTITATDSSAGPGPFAGSRPYSLILLASPITIAPSTLPDGLVGTPYVQGLTASGGTAPYSFAVIAGVLPTGLTLNSAGEMSGTPTAGGTFSFTVAATDSSPGPILGYATYLLTVNAPTITIAPATLPNALGGTPYSQTITASGGTAPHAFSLSAGALPAGLSLNSTGVLSGTPTVGGVFNFTVTATDSSTGTGPFTGSLAYSLTVDAPTITIAPATLPAAAVDAAYNQTITASGGTGPYSFSISAGTLPVGLSFSSAGVLSGTPTAGGTFNFTVTATDAASFTGSRAYTLTVGAPTITISPATLPDALAGTPYLQTLTASGGTAPLSFSLTAGALPAGLSISSAGVLSGTPTVGGIFNFTVTATDSSTGTGPYTGSRAYSLTVNTPTISIAPASLPGGVVGTPYSQTVTASGGTAPYSFSISAGTLPTGTALSSAGNLTGTPTVAGTYGLTITATDALGFSASVAYSIVISEAVPVATNDSATVLAGEAITIPVTANDVGVLSSITIASAPSVGAAIVSGLDVEYTAPATASGTVTFTYTATGPGGTSAPATVTVTINPLPVAVSRTLTTPADTPVQTELTAGATGGPFTAATLVGVTPAGSGNASIAQVGSGYVLTFVPAAGFAGTATVQFTLSNAFATSNVASVQIEVGSRPDPTQDAEVVGLIDAQSEATRRFATAQIGNFQRRLESLHGAEADASGIDNSLSLAMARPCVEVRLGIDDDCRTQDAVAATQLSAVPSERVDAAAPPIAIWIGGTIRSGRQDGRDGRADLDFETDGISIGADYRVSPAFAFGGGVGYGSDRTDVGAHTSRMRGDAYTAALYASFQPGKEFFIDGLVGYQTLSYDLTRYLSGTGGSVTGERDGSQWFASLSAGADIARGDWQITPYGRLDAARAQLDAYVERGDPLLALQYDAMDVDTLTGNLGVRLDFRHDTEWGVFAPLFRVEYQHEFEDSGSFGIRYADLLSGPVYRGDATQFDRSRWMLGLGAMFATDHGWSFRFEVNGVVGSDGQRDTGGMLQVEKRY